MIGRVVSIVVAPPDDMGASGPNRLAMSGVSKRVIISRMMLASKAMVPSSAPRYSVMPMPRNINNITTNIFLVYLFTRLHDSMWKISEIIVDYNPLIC